MWEEFGRWMIIPVKIVNKMKRKFGRYRIMLNESIH